MLGYHPMSTLPISDIVVIQSIGSLILTGHTKVIAISNDSDAIGVGVL